MNAPIVIPTLNRYDHLKECIESLAKNQLANETDLYISIDYPPSNSYKEGYEKICEYIDGGINGFHEVFVYKQKNNLGAKKNTEFIFEKVRKVSNYCILTEDDNVFSSNFLSYMNWALRYFEKCYGIEGVTGYSHPIKWSNTNIPFQIVGNEYNAWGCGIWFDKRDEVKDYITNGSLERKLKEPKNIIKILWYRPDLVMELFRIKNKIESAGFKNRTIQVIDVTYTFFIILEDKKTIMPTITKVNNNGYDGSGVNCGNEYFEQMKLDHNDRWIFEGSVEHNENLVLRNNKSIRKYLFIKKIKKLLRTK